MLKSSREAYRRQGKVMPNPTRLTKVHVYEPCIAAWYHMAARDSTVLFICPLCTSLQPSLMLLETSLLGVCASGFGATICASTGLCAPHAGAAQHVPHQTRPHGACHRYRGHRPADEQRLAVVRQRPMIVSYI